MAEARGKSGKRARLGRGLSAMIEPKSPVVIEGEGPDTRSNNTSDNHMDRTEDAERAEAGHAGGGVGVEGRPGGMSVVGSVVELSVDVIGVNAQQPREMFDEGALAELAASIRAHGVMQPVTVRASGDGTYELIAGERRLRASRMAGLATVPAVVREADDKESAQLALLENIQREDLNPVERARGFEELSRRHGMTQEEISAAVGVSRSAVANAVRLLELDDAVVDMVRTGALSFGHAKVLLGVEERGAQLALAERCVKEGWSVRALESEAVRGLRGEKPREKDSDGAGDGVGRAARVVADLEDRLSAALGTKVRVRTSGGGSKGRIEISFYDLDQFDGLLERMGVSGGT